MEDLKMPELDDYKFPISETEEDQMIDYAYDLRDYAESLEAYIAKIKTENTENLEHVKEKIEIAYKLSEQATELHNIIYSKWFNDTSLNFEQQSKIINISHNQLQVLWTLNRVLNNLITDFENDFKFIKRK